MDHVLSEDTILKLMLTPTQYMYTHDYKLGITPKEIAAKYHVTPAAVSNVLSAARKRIAKSGIEQLKEFLTDERLSYIDTDSVKVSIGNHETITYIDDNGEVKIL